MLRLFIILVFGLACTVPALANDLGQVSVPMPAGAQGDGAQGDDARQAALKQGLERVIARLTGRTLDQVDGLPGVAGVLQTPDKWLLRYGYESADGANQPARLNAVFDARALADYLAGQGAPVWRGPRPSVLVWLVDEGNGRGRMVGADDALAKTVNQAAADRGLQVILPKWDDQDRNALSVSDIRGRFDSPLLEASKRYKSHWIATAVIYGGRQPILNWRLINGGETVAEKRDQVGSKRDALEAMMMGIGKTLAGRYRGASGGESGGQGRVMVRGVKSLTAWQDLKSNLRHLDAVRAVGLRRANGDQLSLLVNFAGSDEQLARALGNLPSLKPCPYPGNEAVSQDSASMGVSAGATAPLTFCER